MRKIQKIMLGLCVVLLLSIPVYADEVKEIHNVEDLYLINFDMDGNYILMNDIDLSVDTAEDGDWNYLGNGWSPIGSEGVFGSTPFTGTFNGNGHIISGLNITVTKNTLPNGVDRDIYLGLFAKNSGTIKNLILKDVHIGATLSNMGLYCGSIAGYNTGTISGNDVYGTISNSVSESERIKNGDSARTDNYAYTGGLVGYDEGGVYYNCSSNGKLVSTASGMYYKDGSYYATAYVDTQYNYVGGIVGFSSDGKIEKCYNTADIKLIQKTDCYERVDAGSTPAKPSLSYLYGGGITGTMSAGQISNCYSTAMITSEQKTEGDNALYAYAGGINGYAQGSITVEKCYSSGTIKEGTGYPINGSKNTACVDCYYLSGTAETQVGAMALTAAQMKLQSLYNAFDFENVWAFDKESDYNYPQIRKNRQDNKWIENISVSDQPEKTIYTLGSPLDLTDAKIEIKYKDGTTEKKAIIESMCSGYDSSILGEQTVNVEYREFTSSFTIKVIKNVKSLSITSQPDITEFIQGTSFDFSGCVAKVTFDDDTTEEIAVSLDDTEGADINTIGEQTVTYKIYGLSTEFKITVIPITVTSISILQQPSKVTFEEGTEVSVDGLKVQATYNNGNTEEITGYTVGEIPTTVGTHIVMVTYESQSCSFEITITEKKNTTDSDSSESDTIKNAKSLTITSQPDTTEFVQGTSFDFSGCVAKVTFDDDTTEEIAVSLDDTEGADINTIGEQTVTYKIYGVSTEFKITVIPVAVTSISILQQPSKVTFEEGTEVSIDGLKVQATYNNGNTEEITGYTVGEIPTTVGTHNVMITYESKSCSFEIIITEKQNTADPGFSEENKDNKVNTDNNTTTSQQHTSSGGEDTPVPDNITKTDLPKIIIKPVKNKKNGTITVKWKKTSDIKGYEVQYALNNIFSKSKKNKTVKSAKKTSLTINKLKKGKTYYVRVRAYKMNGNKKVYGDWSAVKKIKVKK